MIPWRSVHRRKGLILRFESIPTPLGGVGRRR
jgi:hypothetical protein